MGLIRKIKEGIIGLTALGMVSCGTTTSFTLDDYFVDEEGRDGMTIGVQHGMYLTRVQGSWYEHDEDWEENNEGVMEIEQYSGTFVQIGLDFNIMARFELGGEGWRSLGIDFGAGIGYSTRLEMVNIPVQCPIICDSVDLDIPNINFEGTPYFNMLLMGNASYAMMSLNLKTMPGELMINYGVGVRF